MLRPVGSKDLKRLVNLRVLVSGSIESLAARKQHGNTSWRACPFDFVLFLDPLGLTSIMTVTLCLRPGELFSGRPLTEHSILLPTKADSALSVIGC